MKVEQGPLTELAGMPRTSYLYLKIIWCAAVWVIWKERNNRVFQHTVATPYTFIEKVKLYSFLWLKAGFLQLQFT